MNFKNHLMPYMPMICDSNFSMDEKIAFIIEAHNNFLSGFTPLETKDIHTTDNWIKVESIEDLPKEKSDVFIFTKDKRIICTTFYPTNYKGWVNVFTSDSIVGIGWKYVTHYKLINKPNPPIHE